MEFVADKMFATKKGDTVMNVSPFRKKLTVSYFAYATLLISRITVTLI